jgi:hypothetical protein
MNPNRPIVLWRFLDGRSGHENQVIGLCESIAALHPCVFVDIASDMFPRGWRTVLADSWAFAADFQRPVLLIGAGPSSLPNQYAPPIKITAVAIITSGMP